MEKTLRGMMTLKHDYLETPITHHSSLFPDFFTLLSDSYWPEASKYGVHFSKYFQVHPLDRVKSES